MMVKIKVAASSNYYRSLKEELLCVPVKEKLVRTTGGYPLQ
jgi:hypothetical protein